ncbi:hypothetical protein ONS95_002003 [Cadophora gregata]|uniref:uncharacterized protein n=1 Tax=Cadophora gregata TaxID=51156 RepID=UPI0026DC97D8|nr:uncharacterized protein ONS95_002003 [Cadophora gregata]KAK0111658.1 hypothetical protein ONS95_002003 [Cadophora gregata]KAK0111866.1 hypothetical protein ONS96_001134 [Cadophora gregata f. sp. sojae]
MHTIALAFAMSGFFIEQSRLAVTMSSMPCALCDSKEATLCPTCEDAAFCTKHCQAEGEWIHKFLCAIKDEWGRSNPRPNEDSYIAIYFPVDGTGPEFYWSNHRLKVQKNELTGTLERSDLLSVDSDEVNSGNIEITHNLVTKNKLPYPLTFTLRDCRGVDGSTVNLSILEMTQGDQRGLWAGPAVLYRFKDHISIADLTYFATCLKTFKDPAGSLNHAFQLNKLENVEKSRPELFAAVKGKVAAKMYARKVANASPENSEVEVVKPKETPQKVRIRLVLNGRK